MTEALNRMPHDNRIVGQDGRLTTPFQHYLGGIERLDERQAANLDPDTATVSQLVTALINAGLMKAE
jgi:hypothetical protein